MNKNFIMDNESERENCRQNISATFWKTKIRWRSDAEPRNLKNKRKKKLYFKSLKRGFPKYHIKNI